MRWGRGERVREWGGGGGRASETGVRAREMGGGVREWGEVERVR